MVQCKQCGRTFTKAKLVTERHGFSSPPFETRMVCPYCSEGSLVETDWHCRCCGIRVPENTLYCSDACRKRAKRIWENEKRRKRAEEPINRLLRKKEAYNRLHGTHYSYGQFTALKEEK